MKENRRFAEYLDIYDAGYDCAQVHGKRSENPYFYGTSAWLCWTTGWCDGILDLMAAEDEI
jgi:hypothetical protein